MIYINNILIIENEKNLLKVIKTYLEKEGYKVYCTAKGLKGIEIFKMIDISLVVLDLVLPDISGKKVCQIIRKTSNVHIFILIDKGTLNDRIEGLKIGADQYLVKPFSIKELVARVNALFRRLSSLNKLGNENSNLIFDDGRLVINYDKRIIRINGQEIKLTPNEFNILYTLVINKGKVLSRQQLINKIFGVDFDGYDRTIDVHIKNIRKKIEKDTKKPKYIITVMKVGYKFCGHN